MRGPSPLTLALFLFVAEPATALFYVVWGSTVLYPGQSLMGSILVPYVKDQTPLGSCSDMVNAHNYDEYDTEHADPPIESMHFEQGICDSGPLEFVYDESTEFYDVYDTTVTIGALGLNLQFGEPVGYCFRNTDHKRDCWTWFPPMTSVFYEEWECVTKICGEPDYELGGLLKSGLNAYVGPNVKVNATGWDIPDDPETGDVENQ